MLGSLFIRKSTVGQVPGKEFFPLEFVVVVFAFGIILCTAEDPFRPHCWGWAEASSGP